MHRPGNDPVIVLSRTDSIGDVVLTLPMAGYIRSRMPGAKIIFLGRSYTAPVVALSQHISQFVNYDEILMKSPAGQTDFIKGLNATIFIHVFPQKKIAQLAKAARVPLRIGTTNRIYHWFTCNKLVRLSRKNSDLHEAQLNMKLLAPLDIPTPVTLKDMPSFYGFSNIPSLAPQFAALLVPGKRHAILHPKSKGSAREWGIENFNALAGKLAGKGFQVFVGGTADDGKAIAGGIGKSTDITGIMDLTQYIAFIAACDTLVAASTGPLHIAAALGKRAVGIYSSRRPIHPGRWMPVGLHATFIVKDENCLLCKNRKDCNCIENIDPVNILNLISPDELER